MKVLNWIVAFLGLWEFADIAALFFPGFGKIPDFLWNHILVSVLLMTAGDGAARTKNASAAKVMNWMAAGAGVWLIISSYILRYPVIGAGLWNDLIVGDIAFILGVWAARMSSHATG